MKKNAVVIHPQDCVATAITALKAGETATMFIGEREISVVLHQDVAVHKKRERDPKKMRHHVVSHFT